MKEDIGLTCMLLGLTRRRKGWCEGLVDFSLTVDVD